MMQTEPGFPVDVVGTTELHATFREESRTSLFLASAALQEIREATGLFVVPARRDHTSRPLSGQSNCESALSRVRSVRPLD
jgi:hypothetical protein